MIFNTTESRGSALQRLRLIFFEEKDQCWLRDEHDVCSNSGTIALKLTLGFFCNVNTSKFRFQFSGHRNFFVTRRTVVTFPSVFLDVSQCIYKFLGAWVGLKTVAGVCGGGHEAGIISCTYPRP